jgi:hypothetical protein
LDELSKGQKSISLRFHKLNFCKFARAQLETQLGKCCRQLCRLNRRQWQCSKANIEVDQKAKLEDRHFLG